MIRKFKNLTLINLKKKKKKKKAEEEKRRRKKEEKKEAFIVRKTESEELEDCNQDWLQPKRDVYKIESTHNKSSLI